MRTMPMTSPLTSLRSAMAMFVLSVCLLPGAALAKGKIPDPKDLVFNKEQIGRMQQLFAGVDAKIKAATKGDEAQTKAMQADLRAISALKDAAEQGKAITAYQSKYAKQYELVLKKSGVDLAQLAAQLNALFPALQFRAQPNFTVVSRLRQTFAAPGTPTAPTPKTKTTEIKGSEYTDHKDLSCGAISGSSVSFGSTHVTNNGFAAEAGGCTNTGDKTAEISIPAGAISARLDAKAKLSVEAFAVGVLGAAGSNAGAFIFIETGAADVDSSESVYVSVIAPFLWAGSAEESTDPARAGAVLQPGAHATLTASTSTFSVAAGVVAETHATAKVSGLEASTTIEQ